MKRVLSLVLAFVLVLGMIPAFAADSAEQKLVEAGFINGGRPADKLTRAELSVLVNQMNGVADEADDWVIPSTFADADDAAWANGHIAVTVLNGWMVGVGDNKFNPNGEASPQMVAAVMLNALNYKVGTDVEWANVLEFAADLGIVLPAANTLTRAQAFEAMWSTVNTVVNGGEQTLGVKLGKLKEEKPVVTALEVKEVTATNLKAMTIEFNQAVDKDTVVAANFKVVKGSSTLESTPTLLEDGKTVVVVLTSNLVQSDSVKLTIEKVKDLKGNAIEKFEQTYIVNDVNVPTLQSVVALNPKQLELTFSEPVNFAYSVFTLHNDIKINNTAVIATTELDHVNNTVVFTLASALPEGTHSIEVKGIKDFANFTAPTATMTFLVVKDEAAPVAESVTVKSKTVVAVTFNEPVATNARGYFRIDGVDVTTVDWKNSKTVELTVPGTGLGIGAIVEVKVEYKGQKDIMGNEVKDWTAIITKVADDSTLPSVELTSVGATNNRLTLTFSKSMAAAGTIELLNKDNVVVRTVTVPTANVAAFKANTDSKVLEVTLSELAGINPADYSVRIKDMKDSTIRGNALATTTLTFKANDTLAPTVGAEYVVTNDTSTPVNTDKDTITIFFSEAMDVATIENLANYSMGGTPFSANSAAVSAKAAADAKSVVITYKNARALANGTQIAVFAVKDAAGNVILPTGVLGQNLTAKGATTPLVVNTVEALDVNTVRVTFNSVIKTVDPSAFVLVNSASGNAVTGFASATIDSTNQARVTFKTASAMSTSASIYSVKVNSPASIANIYNQTLTLGALTPVLDKVAPTLTSVATLTVGGVAQDNAIVFTFSEGLDATAVAAFRAGLLVKGSNGAVLLPNINDAAQASVVYADNKVTVTFSGGYLNTLKGTSQNGNKAFKVSFPTGLGIVDQHTNALQPVADQDVTIKINN